MELRERIELIRQETGMSKAAFSRHLGFPNPQVIQDLSSGKTKSISPDVRNRILSAFPKIDSKWLLTGEGEMLGEETPTQPVINYKSGVPYYDEDFVLGFTDLGFPSSESPQFLVQMPKYKNATLWCNATGHSMEPEINNGDLVALQLIDDPSFLLLGDIYAIVTTNGLRTIKRLAKSDKDDCFRLIATNKDYDSQDIPKKMILRVFRVLGNLHSF